MRPKLLRLPRGGLTRDRSRLDHAPAAQSRHDHATDEGPAESQAPAGEHIRGVVHPEGHAARAREDHEQDAARDAVDLESPSVDDLCDERTEHWVKSARRD